MSLPGVQMARRVFVAFLAGAAMLGVHQPVFAHTIAVIGTGNVGGALGPRFAEIGHTVVYGSRSPQRADVRALVAETGHGATAMLPPDAVRDAEIVVLAVKWADAEVATKSLGDLSGKIILDPTNAVIFSDDGFRRHAVETSAAQMIQSWAPGARVVKAFNTLSSETMADPSLAGGPMSIPIVGDDTDAKAVIAQIIEDMGFDAVDMGGLEFAGTLEKMLVVRGNAAVLGTPFNYYFRPVPAN